MSVIEKKNYNSTPFNYFPLIISIIGSKKSGKTTLFKSLVLYFLETFDEYLYGPLIIMTKNDSALLLIESSSDTLSVSNLAKVSDIVILAIDGYFGLELEAFEFISFANSHGVPRILIAMTHIDLFLNWKDLKKSKRRIKSRLKKEMGNQIKVFYLSGITLNEKYFTKEISNLTRFFSPTGLKNSVLQKTLSYIFVFRMYFVIKHSVNHIKISGFQKGNSLEKTSTVNGFIPGIGIIYIQKYKKIMKPGKPQKDLLESLNIKKLNTIGKKKETSPDLFFQQKNDNIILSKRVLNYFTVSILTRNKSDKNQNKIPPKSINSNKISIRSIFRKNLGSGITMVSSFKKFPVSKFFPTISSSIKSHNNSKDLSISNPSDLVLKGFKKKSIFKQISHIEIILEDLPAQFYRYFDPTFAIILCIDPCFLEKKELSVAIVNCHKWNKKMIRSKECIFLSIGWQFFETSLFFFKQLNSKKACIRKRLSKNLNSSVCFYAPFLNHGLGVVGMMSPGFYFCVKNKGALFNVIFTGILVKKHPFLKIYKKIKLRGIIYKSFKKTSFVKGMFFDEVEITRFMGSFIYGRLGERGIIKKAAKNELSGSFRVSFEKKMEKGEHVFLKLLVPLKLNYKFLTLDFFSIPNDFKEIDFIRETPQK